MKNDTFSVFILKAHVSSLAHAETFLKNRKWTVASSSNLKEALAYIIKNQPQYVLITADHPNKKVKILPKMLMQAFPLKVIGFAEKTGSDSGRSLTGMSLEYNLYPPVSGPAIERMVLKIRRDEELKAKEIAEGKTQFSGKSESGDQSITLKGGSPVADDQSQTFESARAALAQLMNSDAENELSTKSDIYIQKGGPQNKFNETEKGPESSQNFQEREDAQKKSRESGYHDQQTPPAGPNGYNPDHQAKDEQGNPISSGSLQSPTPQKMSPTMEAEYQRRKDKKIRYLNETAQVTDKDSIIVKGTAEALAGSVNVTGHEEKEIEDTSNVACITIESPRFSGYLICALAEDQKVDKALIEMINKRLMSFLKENGENVKDQDAMEIKIQAVDFIDWSIEQAQFLKKSTHNGHEIAMAFFPHGSMKTSFEVSGDGPEKMIKLQLEELKADTPVEFDLYIYMPENNKYILYTPEGGNLYARQKDRLHAKGVTHMHVKEAAIAGIKKYQAQNYLNDQIDIYKKNKKTEAA